MALTDQGRSAGSRLLLAAGVMAILASPACREPPGPPAPPVAAEAGPAARQVTVVSTPPGAEVFAAGRSRGRTPLTVRLDPGRHHLVLRYPGYLPFETDVTVTAGADERVEAQLMSSH
jgi:hypothetical protein